MVSSASGRRPVPMLPLIVCANITGVKPFQLGGQSFPMLTALRTGREAADLGRHPGGSDPCLGCERSPARGVAPIRVLVRRREPSGLDAAVPTRPLSPWCRLGPQRLRPQRAAAVSRTMSVGSMSGALGRSSPASARTVRSTAWWPRAEKFWLTVVSAGQ